MDSSSEKVLVDSVRARCWVSDGPVLAVRDSTSALAALCQQNDSKTLVTMERT